jgi:Family of unknown function (DUF6152)
MRSKFCTFLLSAAIVLLVSAPLRAHHGSTAYDLKKTITSKATVTSLTWTNPHCLLNFDMKDDSGTVQNWHVEMYNPLYMERAGWSKDILKAGDEITISFHPTKNGTPNGFIRAGDGKVTFNGKELSLVEGDGSSDTTDPQQ